MSDTLERVDYRRKDERIILEVENLSKSFEVREGLISYPKSVKAVNDVSFHIKSNETYSLVGESGCGKSTLGRSVLRLIEPTSGKINYRGVDLTKLSNKEMQQMRPKMQMVFQDPYSSLNPKKTIGNIIEEAMVINKVGKSNRERTELAMEMLKKVGIRPDQYYRYPHEFSGGQKQRIGLARALVLNPEIIVCDEPVSALDVSIQSQVLNLLNDLKHELNVSYLFIAHNMSVVRYISDRVGVMYLGQIVEEAETEELFTNPKHPYTQALLSAVPEANPHIKGDRIALQGEIPSPLDLPSGCKFHNRCPKATEKCKRFEPLRREFSLGHYVSCHY